MKRLVYSIKFRNFVLQALVLAAVLSGLGYLLHNAHTNLQEQNIASGFGFLLSEAAFEIGEGLITFDSTNSYLRALGVGFLNTLTVAVIGNFLAILFGIVVGVASVSQNFLVRKLASGYVESLRNIPLLLQLFFWYVLWTEFLPSVRAAEPMLGGIFLTQRGVFFPAPENMTLSVVALVLILGLLFSFYKSYSKTRQVKFGAAQKVVAVVSVVCLVVSFQNLTFPTLQGFNFAGGGQISPEFSAVLMGLVLYTSAFIAEIVRSGIESIDRGQVEAGQSLGLTPSKVFQFIVMPQALRVIIPPTTSQMLNLTKNSSLAVAIGYPDLVNVGNTVMNQTGQAVECIIIIMSVYLVLSLLTSLFMNFYNSRIQLVGARA